MRGNRQVTAPVLAALLLLTTLASGGPNPQRAIDAAAAPCAPRRAAGGVVVASLAMERAVAGADTLLSVIVCLRSATPAEAIGSFHGEVRYDTMTARVVGVDHLAGGAQQENTADRGRIRFAGAVPHGADTAGALLRVRLRTSVPGRVPWVDLAMLEVNSTQGAALISRVRVSGLADGPSAPTGGFAWEGNEHAGDRPPSRTAQARLRAPVIYSIDPRRVTDRGQGEAHVVTIRGRHFGADDNVVLFGSVRIPGVRSTRGGTVLRFTVPTEVVTGGEAPPQPVGAGRYRIRVQTSGGTSGALVFRLVDG